jgi:hypothetical protein
MPTKKDIVPTPSRQQPEEIQDEHAATLATRHLINPREGKLQEVSYLPIGAVHALTMLQTFEEYFDNLLIQIQNQKIWYLRRYLNKQITKGEIQLTDATDAINAADKAFETEKIDLRNLFIARFRHAFYQHSRGKDGKFVEALTMLADTDMQTRNPDMEDSFKSPTRNQ